MSNQQPADFLADGCLSIIKAAFGVVIGFIIFLFGIGQFLPWSQLPIFGQSFTSTKFFVVTLILGAVVLMVLVVRSGRLRGWKSFLLGVLIGICLGALLAGACAGM